MTAYLVTDLMEETRRNLLGMHRANLNDLANDMDAVTPTVTFSFSPDGITRGDYLGIEDEIMYVWSIDVPSRTATVARGKLGTTPAPHLGATNNVDVEANPRFARYAIRYALREEIRSWGPQVYQVKSTTVQCQSSVRGYDLQDLITDNFYNIISVRRSTPTITGRTNQESWPKIKHWQIIRNAPQSDFSSGCGLVIPDSFQTGVNFASADGISLTFTGSPLPTLNVVYACPFNVDTFDDTTDLIQTVGLDQTMIDIPPIGAAWRLLSQKETLRTIVESQGLPADLQNVPPLYIAKAASALKAQRDSRLNDAQVWLMNRYGIENWGL